MGQPRIMTVGRDIAGAGSRHPVAQNNAERGLCDYSGATNRTRSTGKKQFEGRSHPAWQPCYQADAGNSCGCGFARKRPRCPSWGRLYLTWVGLSSRAIRLNRIGGAPRSCRPPVYQH